MSSIFQCFVSYGKIHIKVNISSCLTQKIYLFLMKTTGKTVFSDIFNTTFLWRFIDKEFAVILKRI